MPRSRSQENLQRLEEAVVCCTELGLDVVIVPNFLPKFISRATPGRLFGDPVLRLDGSPQFRDVMAAKRAFDIVGASVLLVAALPVLAVAAVGAAG